MNARRFSAALAEAMVGVLRYRAPRLAPRVLDCVALDVQPWDGVINLSVRHSGDRAPRVHDSRVLVADWELSGLGRAHETAEHLRWPEAAPLAEELRTAFASKSSNTTDKEFAKKIYGWCADAIRHRKVWRALDAFDLTDRFCCVVCDADDPNGSIFIGDPRPASKRSGPKRRTRLGGRGKRPRRNER